MLLPVVATRMAPQLLAIRRRPFQGRPPQFPSVEVDGARQPRPAVAAAVVAVAAAVVAVVLAAAD